MDNCMLVAVPHLLRAQLAPDPFVKIRIERPLLADYVDATLWISVLTHPRGGSHHAGHALGLIPQDLVAILLLPYPYSQAHP